MPLKRKLPPETKAQKARHDAMREIGCIVARMKGLGYVPGEIHHLLESGKTISHDDTICLNVWSHRGEPLDGYTSAACLEMFGPSFGKGSKPFHREFGDNQALLAEQERLLARFGFRG